MTRMKGRLVDCSSPGLSPRQHHETFSVVPPYLQTISDNLSLILIPILELCFTSVGARCKYVQM